MYDYKLLEAFTAVIENKGFEKAAAKLHITQSAVSQRVRLLEEQAGQILLVRANPPSPTDAGKKLMTHFRKVRLLESELESELSAGVGAFTQISVGLNADTLATWFFDAVQGAVLRHKILLDLRVDDQEVTHRMMKDGEVAGCISTRDTPFQSCTVSPIGTMTYRMLASAQTYRRHFAGGLSTDVLKDVPLIVYNEKDTLHLQIFEKCFGGVIPDFHAMYVPSVEQYLDAVLRGFGVGMMSDNQCKSLLDNGILIDAFAPHTVQTKLYWHRWSIGSKPLDVISKALHNNPMLI
jgi:LysR family transcriptional regulator (chromosome initiation inhibitor)